MGEGWKFMVREAFCALIGIFLDEPGATEARFGDVRHLGMLLRNFLKIVLSVNFLDYV